MPARRLGLLLVVCAPSGTGKSTLIKRLCAEFPALSFSVSATTRAPRPGETPDVDYHFLTRETFLDWREAGRLAEWAEVHGNFYGTPLEPVRQALAAGRDMLFDIDIQGAAQLRQSLGSGAYVFILPPSRSELSRRLSGRGTDSPEVVARRLAAAPREIEAAPLFDYWVENDGLEAAYEDLRAVYMAERRRPRYHPDLLRELLVQWEAAI
ncbi:guanylate kinase [Solidesulfovibrio carbinoliphilus subsp. oakridgensis]|uniref:Guanylate kinase n=1 Tax=Solidesulfovibrio carbinoliphilus subsp. oakridgensis TaxID=694327 RepID=G7Q4M9_9BACT|nr:guanylate kinase [Solidesulfovibrio carbinoliphilus]EHJ47489.1 guanylate kinase [Solidesulfovibrio carbinoliphilus subsp. oakridgensis]